MVKDTLCPLTQYKPCYAKCEWYDARYEGCGPKAYLNEIRALFGRFVEGP